jgi:ABC-type nitrate/sulfonate/bicarbonate transport system ATPase subunit
MASGISILMVTHDPNQAQRLGSERYRMTARRMEKA